ncbi:GPI-anchored wall transfer protein 1 [Hortaea werneckii]|nr:GPI-anchored wall transfer protein 1 [Hortaea werneckii]
MDPEYKAAKEAHVSLLSGGGIWEINAVTCIAPAAALLWSVLQTRQSFFKPYSFPAATVDFLLHCLCILGSTTVYASAPQVLIGLISLPAIATYLQPTVDTKPPARPPVKSGTNGKSKDDDGSADGQELDPLPIKPYITTYRGAMMIVTCTSILAVDFNCFPRRFAKTESFGTSLMDMGVGSFVFAAGIVAARQVIKEQVSGTPSFINRMKTALRHSLPLFVLGMVRLLSIKGLDYVEHVSEYGVHWNFFFTLSLLPIATAILQPLLNLVPSLGAFAFIIAMFYELFLHYVPGTMYYIILSERKEGDWLSQNREGVYSFVGYLCIFIAGMGIGTCILPRTLEEREPWRPGQQAPGKKDKNDPLDEDADWLANVLSGAETKKEQQPEPEPQFKPEFPQVDIWLLVKWTGLWFVLSVFFIWKYGPILFVSRRMANLPYITWVCAFNCGQLFLFCAIEKMMFPNIYEAKDKQTEKQRIQDATSRIMQAFNRNGLFLFMLANLLTGAINMTVPTLHLGDVESLSILVGYIAVVAGVGLALDHYNISIKL